jgi:glycosyltransferase involved in cell wall biosynthesis
MVTRLLNRCGLYLGEANDLLRPAGDNPAGYWENTHFSVLNEKILARLGGAWDVPPPMAAGWESQAGLAALRAEAKQLVDHFQAYPTWGWKDPRNSLTLPFWKSVIPDLKVVICLRQPLAVAWSLNARGQSSLLFGLALWLSYNRAWLSTPLEECVVTHYDAYFNDPARELRRVVSGLGLEVSDEALVAACHSVAAPLRHQRASAKHFTLSDIPSPIIQLYQTLCTQAEWTDNTLSLNKPSEAEPALFASAPLPAAASPATQLLALERLLLEKDRVVAFFNSKLEERERAVASLNAQLQAALAPAAPQTNPTARPLAICTIISKNYLAQARCLAESFLNHHPGGQVFALLVDHLDGYFDPAQEPFVMVSVEDLNIPHFKSLAFGYTVTELNTAVKPFFLEYLFQRFDLQQLCYFDPDILIYEPLADLTSKLEQFGIVLTPHLSGFLNDENIPNELTILVSGAYNLGFIGLARHPELETFLQWWQRKLLKYCTADIRQGLFVDQRWIDLAPTLFSSVHILRDPGYNVAYWNLQHRPLRPANGGYTVDNASLKFFHFSGFQPEKMETLSKYQDRFTFKELGEVKKLFLHYRRRLIAHGYATVHQWPYAYGAFEDGVRIADIFRQIYRATDSEGHRWPNPFAQAGDDTFCEWLNQPADQNGNSPRLITNLSLEIYRLRPDLQAAFPDINGRDRLRFANWFIIDAQRQHTLDEHFIQPIREAVAVSFESNLAATPETTPPETVTPEVKPAVKLILRLRSLMARRVMQLNASQVGQWIKRLLGQRLTSRLKFHFWNIFNPPPTRTAWPLPAQSPSTERAAAAPGLNLVGYIHSETGVGEAARNTLRALQSQGYPAAYTNLKYELARQADQSCNDIPEGNPYAVNLIHANADQVPGVLKTIGSDFFADKYNIGFWFWELTSFPEMWREHASVFNEIWVASSFTQATLAPLLPIPVVRMRPCIEVTPAEGINRQALGLPENKFIFLFTFDILSICERKNPWAVIEAYRQAFGTNSQEAALVIKVNNLQRALGLEKALGLELGFETQLAQAIDSVSGILMEAHLDRGVVNALYNCCDCFVSLHRSEGFGLSLAESMYLGKPCIATAYSSNMDFMTPANSYLVDYQLVTLDRDYGPYQTGSVWADPDVRSAAGLMRRVFENPEEAAQKGKLAAADIRCFYSADSAGREMIRRLELVAHAPPGV